MRPRRFRLLALALLQAGAAGAQVSTGEPIPKPELQLLSDVVRYIKRDFAGAIDDTVLASGCADSVAALSGSTERAARSLDAIPPLLMRAKTAAPVDPGYRRLVHGCIEGMVSMLDHHSKFMSESEFRAIYRSSGGSAATGLEVRKEGETLSVIEALPGTPAAKAGLRAGDRIVRIDGSPVGGLAQNEAVNRLRGVPGSVVALSVERAGSPKRLEAALKREVIRPATARAQWGEADILQMRIVRFAEDTRTEMLKELAALPDAATREPRGVVLDLRDNSGGTLLAAVDLSGLFLEDGVEVGATRGRGFRLIQSFRANERERLTYYSPAVPMRLSQALKRVPVAVLVNQHTAAGAEILAAALKGNGRAQLVGARTLGMGSVQTLFPLAGGAALKVTTAYWHAPKDVQLDGRPLQPDVPAAPDGAMREALRTVAEAARK